ncbi:DNA gyrase subunit A [Pelagibius sp.]|uniref:DNA gyrase subunit A n=1 Tax=Pelagibius sp. TaxID=1931238 RepID=UPI003BB0861C
MSDPSKPSFDHDITPVTIEDEMKRSYLDYAMSVIVARALPDVRDGLKPVHRRILYAMKEAGYDWNRPYRKSARVVGDVMGQYHPHGDSAIYDTMVRMAQDFSMRLQLIDGQGNFGSMDGDPPAAMRYTEARLTRVASDALLDDIDENTVDFQDNYDESTKEPVVLPARFPNLLVNGAGGIAVGMATNIPPHNLGEVIDGCLAYIDKPDISIDGLMEFIPGPDFPTGGIILGRAGIRDAYHTGRGSLRVRAKTEIEEIRKDRMAIIVSEVPFQVNKARMLERIAELVRAKTIEGIADLRDESDRQGLRVVIELRRDAEPDVVLNQLFRHSQLQGSFGCNILALNGGRPEVLDLRAIIGAFIDFREEVVTRRTAFRLGKARDRAHLLVGLAIAVANIDPVIALIRAAPDPVAAREGLMAQRWPAKDVAPLIALIDEPGRVVEEDGSYSLSEAQARAILELRLQRLTGLEREKIAAELQEIAAEIKEYLEILSSREKLLSILREEFNDMKARFATPRRTLISDHGFEQEDEDLIQREDMVVTVSHGGYIKRVPLSTYRAQRRGGKGRAGMATRDEDFVSQVFVCNTHTPVLFFSSRGMVYKLKVYRLPVGTPQARGKALINLLPLAEGEVISTFMPMPEDETTWDQMYVVFATSDGNVRRNKLSDFVRVMANGKIAMKLEDGDSELVAVRPCAQDDDILLATAGGRCIRFSVSDVRVFAGRTSTGVRGIKLGKGDKVISMTILRSGEAESTEERDAYRRYASAKRRGENGDGDGVSDNGIELSQARLSELAESEQFILSVADDGYGKRTSAYEYRLTGRGGRGIGNMDLSRHGGRESGVIAAFPVGPGDQIMLVTDGGKLIRSPVEDIRIAGRTTRGVMLFRIDESERIVSVAHLPEEETDDEDETVSDDPVSGGEGGPGPAAGPGAT